MAGTKKESEKLVRCVCGQVYDTIKQSACPQCGKEVGEAAPAKKKTSRTVSPSRETNKPAASAPVFSTRQVLTAALGFLIVVFLITKVAGFFNKETAGADVPAPAPGMVLPKQDITPAKTQPKTSPALEIPSGTQRFMPTPVRSGGVDQVLIGTWYNITQSNGGSQRWYLQMFPDGRYTFAVGGDGVNYQHSGVMTAKGGKWQMTAQTMSHTDAGTYKIQSINEIEMTGQQGTWKWYREGTDMNNPVPTNSNPQPPKSLQNDYWQQQQQNQYSYDTLKQKAAQMAQDFLRSRSQQARR